MSGLPSRSPTVPCCSSPFTLVSATLSAALPGESGRTRSLPHPSRKSGRTTRLGRTIIEVVWNIGSHCLDVRRPGCGVGQEGGVTEKSPENQFGSVSVTLLCCHHPPSEPPLGFGSRRRTSSLQGPDHFHGAALPLCFGGRISPGGSGVRPAWDLAGSPAAREASGQRSRSGG